MKFTTQGFASAGLDLVPPFSVDIRLDPNWVKNRPARKGPQNAQLDQQNEVEAQDISPSLRISERDAILKFKYIARVLPNRRVSGHADLAHESGHIERVFAKIFYGEGARRYWQRELLGAQRLQRVGVNSAAVIGRGATADELGFVVLYQVIEEAQNVHEADDQEVQQVVGLLAQLHAGGFMQTDVHLNNFLRSRDEVFAVDADGIRRGRLLRQHFSNLALFFAQRSPIFDKQIPHLWSVYAHVRGDYVTKMGSAEHLAKLTKSQRRQRIRRYLAKTQRACSEFVARKTWRYNWLCSREQSQRLQRFMLFPEAYFEPQELSVEDQQLRLLKAGNSATVVRVNIEGQYYIIKRYNIKGFAHRVRRWFKKRGRNAWCNGHLLNFLGIPTARPIALLEQKWGWFVGVTYLLMPDCGADNLADAVRDDPTKFDNLAPQVAAIMQQLQAAELCHGDLKATNFVIREQQLALIDYDAVESGDHAEDRARFLRNWQDDPDMLKKWQTLLNN